MVCREEGGREGFRACLADLEDPRSGKAQRHELDEIVMSALLATLCGAETCVDMALFGRAKETRLRRFLQRPGGIPSHDTFSRVFRLLDPAAFETCFARDLAALSARVWSRSTARPRAAPAIASRAGRLGP